MTDYKSLLLAELARLGSPSLEDLAVEALADSLDANIAKRAREQAAVQEVYRAEKRREILSALDRLTWGTFGECEDCGKEISPKRLNFLPWTPRCLECQIALETQEAPEPHFKSRQIPTYFDKSLLKPEDRLYGEIQTNQKGTK